jgi:TctA family transporter
MNDLVVLLIFGVIGYFMVLYRWPRPPLIIGFLLGNLAETTLYSSVTRYGLSWIYRPKVLIILLITVAFALYPFAKKKLFHRKVRPNEI